MHTAHLTDRINVIAETEFFSRTLDFELEKSVAQEPRR
jgi:hypothetical protein